MKQFVDSELLTAVYKLLKPSITNLYKNYRPKDYVNPSVVIRHRNISTAPEDPIQRSYLQVLIYSNLYSNGMLNEQELESLKSAVISALSNGITVATGTVYLFEPIALGNALIDPENPQEAFKEIRFKIYLVENNQ